MAKIVSDFPGLPLETDLSAPTLYQLIYYQLTRMGLTVPATAADLITRAELLDVLQTHAGKLLKDEITVDPVGVGYAGKSDAQIYDLVQTFQAIPGEGPTRLSVLWQSLPMTPNAIVVADITAAKV
jgi:hypothetical protein